MQVQRYFGRNPHGREVVLTRNQRLRSKNGRSENLREIENATIWRVTVEIRKKDRKHGKQEERGRF